MLGLPGRGRAVLEGFWEEDVEEAFGGMLR